MKGIYKLLFAVLHFITPTYCKKDLNTLGKVDQWIIGAKYWLTLKVLD